MPLEHIREGDRYARLYLTADQRRWYWCMNHIRAIGSGNEERRDAALEKAKAVWMSTVSR